MPVKLAILAAGIGDFLWILILLGSLVVWIINQLKASQEAGNQAGRQPPPRIPGQHEDQWQAEEDEWDDTEGVSEHVRHHMDTHEFDDRSGGMGQLSHLDDSVDEHVHEAFDHQIGTLASEPGRGDMAAKTAPTGPNVPTAAAAGIAEVFANPDQLRQAIILQEILRRPEW